MSINFWIVLLEWYEFSVYNSLIPYNIFGGEAHFVTYGFALSALSFLARPAGAIYFGGIQNKSVGLRLGLLLMCAATFLMALCPNIDSLKPLWFGICKVMHGFAIGGSYGLAYLPIYNEEKKKSKPRTNYRLAIVQTGWVYGMLAGEFTVLLLKILIGNLRNTLDLIKNYNFLGVAMLKPTAAFSDWGWRLGFGLSAIIALILYISTNKIAVKKQPVENILGKIISYIKRNPYLFVCIFAVASIDMILFHSWFTYYEVAQEINNNSLSLNLISNLRKILLIILFPIFGQIADKMNKILDKHRGNTIMLIGVYLMMSLFSIIKVSTISWVIISSITAAMCYSSVITWTIHKLGASADFMTGPIFNLSGALIGGTIPLITTILTTTFGPTAPGFFTIALVTISFLSLICARF